MDDGYRYINDSGKEYFVSSKREVFEEFEKPKEPYEDEYDYFEEETGCECKKRRPRMIEVDRVLGIGSGQTMVEVCIPLCPPAVEVMTCLAVEKVIFDSLTAQNNKVFINGRLLKNIPYKTRHECGCISSCNTKCAIGEVPFIICVNVPGAVKGQKVVVLDYDVNSVNLPNCGCGCLIRSITEKDCISVKVKVVKPAIMRLHNEECY